ncbi:MAG: Na+/H+ antiporter subunit E [Myxococcota bacterium]|nr:Na+/H+ antiporter subunit E [Myxococcota bacterium]
MKVLRKIPLALGFVAFFTWELVRSSLQVAYDVVTPANRRQPAIFCVELDVKRDIEIALLANLLTLTPGTMALGVSQDRSSLLVHAMFAPDIAALRRQIKDGYERRVKELLA